MREELVDDGGVLQAGQVEHGGDAMGVDKGCELRGGSRGGGIAIFSTGAGMDSGEGETG